MRNKKKIVSALMAIVMLSSANIVSVCAEGENEVIPMAVTQTSVDNSSTKYFPLIADQGDTDSSVGYATTYYQMTYAVSKALDADSSEYTFSPDWTYSLINEGNDEGAYASDAYKVLNVFGAPLISEFTGSSISMETDAEVWKSAMRYKLNADGKNNHYQEATFNDTDSFIASMKQKLAAGEVLVTGSNAGWWYGDDEKETVTLFRDGIETSEKGVAYITDNGANKDDVRQLVTVVGYDDNIVFKYGPYTTTGAFKIANSRGTDWGNDGYIWVSYEAFYQDSEYRPAKRNGYGFTSAWWWQELDQNVYYSMSVSGLPYTPKYIGVLTFNNQDISDMVLSYRGRTLAIYSISSPRQIYDNTQYIRGMSSKNFTGSIAFDLSTMNSYFTNSGACWEVISDGITSALLKIYNQNGDIVYTGSGTSWHTHVYDITENYTYGGGNWYRHDKCPLCDATIIVSGVCYYHEDFEDFDVDDMGNNGQGLVSTETDSQGNKYLKIDKKSTSFFELCYPRYGAYSSLYMSGNIEMKFDVKFEGDDADIMLKRRQPDIDNIVLRICIKEGSRLMYGRDSDKWHFTTSSGSWIENALNQWYTIQITANITDDASKAKQSIKVINKNTGALVTSVDNVNLQNNDSFCNLFVIGGNSTVNIDNITIRKIS